MPLSPPPSRGGGVVLMIAICINVYLYTRVISMTPWFALSPGRAGGRQMKTPKTQTATHNSRQQVCTRQYTFLVPLLVGVVAATRQSSSSVWNCPVTIPGAFLQEHASYCADYYYILHDISTERVKRPSVY